MEVKVMKCGRATENDPVKRSRRAFAFVNGMLYIQNEDDNRPMHVALTEEENLTGEYLGGYYDDYNIVFFMRNGHNRLDVEMITEDKVHAVWNMMMPKADIAVWAGVVKGEVGKLWPPERLVGCVDIFAQYKTIGR